MGIEVIAVDGPAGSGKSTVSSNLALALNFNLLISGALYRILGNAINDQGIDPQDKAAVAELVSATDVEFIPGKNQVRVIHNGHDVTDDISGETYAAGASYIGAIPRVREAMIDLQHRYRVVPGLVAEGRDMGNVVFPEAGLKVFLTASIDIRAKRRMQQLNKLGISANLSALAQSILRRDDQDMERPVAPLKLMSDAVLVDTSDMTIDETVGVLIEMAREHGISPAGC